MTETDSERGRAGRFIRSPAVRIALITTLVFYIIIFAGTLFSRPLEIGPPTTLTDGQNPKLVYLGPQLYCSYLSITNDLKIQNVNVGGTTLINSSVTSYDVTESGGTLHFAYCKSSYLYYGTWSGSGNATSTQIISNYASLSNIKIAINDDGTIYVVYVSSNTVRMVYKSGGVWTSESTVPESVGTSNNPDLKCIGTSAYIVWQDSRNGRAQPFIRRFSPGFGLSSEILLSDISAGGSSPSFGYMNGVYFVFTATSEGVRVYTGTSYDSLSSNILMIKTTGVSKTFCSFSSNKLILTAIFGSNVAVKTLTPSGWGFSEQIVSAASPAPIVGADTKIAYLSGSMIYVVEVLDQEIETTNTLPLDLTDYGDTVFDELVIPDAPPEGVDVGWFDRAKLTSGSVLEAVDERLLEAFPILSAIGNKIPFVTDYPTISLIGTGIIAFISIIAVILVPQFLYRRRKAKKLSPVQTGDELAKGFTQYSE